MLLAVETSCDESSVALVHQGQVLVNLVSSQVALHQTYGGVVPELATREHLKNLSPLVREALALGRIRPADIEVVAATQGPGLPPALWIGFNAAQALAFALDRPFFGVNHHEAHLYSPWILGDPLRADWESFEPSVSLIVSGGHTLLVHVRGEQEHELIGHTIDDAAGECFDKAAKLMGLPYPGGPEIDRLSVGGDPKAYAFPRPLLHDGTHDFSFAGLKTSVRYFLQKNPELLGGPKGLADVCASVQAAIVEVLVVKTIRAARSAGVTCITASGGVSCNRTLRRSLREACDAEGLRLRLADPALCTDNAAMIGILAERHWQGGISPVAMDSEIHPNWPLSGRGSRDRQGLLS